jgi:2,4-dienoyl-CoA reductase-like NADH-dependent reductase (Old Yellow Enzyme family)
MSVAGVRGGVSPRLETPIEIGGLDVRNRLYRSPLLECAGEGPDAAATLRRALEPAAEAGAGLICQGASPVRPAGGRVAPNMTGLADPELAADLRDVTDAVHDHGARIVAQLDEGGLRSLEAWHAAYRAAHPDRRQLAVSKPPALLRLADRLGVLDLDARVLSTAEVHDLAAAFGRAAEHAVAAGYDGLHIAGANAGIVQQSLSPYYNRRDDEFGGSPAARARFLECVHDEIRERVGNVPLVTKVPAESAAPRFARPRISTADGVDVARRAERIGYDAVAPVETSVLWDMSLVRGAYPERAWNDETFQEGYRAAFRSRSRARLVALLNRLQARQYDFEPAWNADFCRRVRGAVSIPVLCEGGIRERTAMDRLLGDACGMVGLGRPFYAEPRLPARLLDGNAGGSTDADPSAGPTTDDAASPNDAAAGPNAGVEAVCDSCNNCTIPQVAGAPGTCRTPAVLRKRGELDRAGAYERPGDRAE